MKTIRTNRSTNLTVAWALVLGIVSGVASAQTNPADTGYLTEQRGTVIRNGYNQCWHTGTGPAIYTAECDPARVPAPLAQAAVPPPPPTAASPRPAGARITLDADTLFDFNKADLRPAGKLALDDFLEKMKGIDPEVILAVGHADRFGSEVYNQSLSEKRATSVKTYLVSKGVRSRLAMKSMYERLVRHDDSVVQLLDPPFDASNLDPGYIRGYVPGVRENGGQYTHGAIWAAMAFAALGDRKRAWELLAMINPVNHARSAAGIDTYKVEPYVVAADVYALDPHTGRGGWSWYTGSAGWMYRLVLESLLGLKLAGDKLHLAPCLPPEWQTFRVHYRYRETVYHIDVSQAAARVDGTHGMMIVRVDGVEQYDKSIPLVDDQQEHQVEVNVCAQ